MIKEIMDTHLSLFSHHIKVLNKNVHCIFYIIFSLFFPIFFFVAISFQMLVYLFYFTPYYIWMIFILLKPKLIQQPWVIDWAIIHAGAAAQAQFCHIGSSLHYRTPYSLRVPQTPVYCSIFWLINLMLLAVPQFFMMHCQAQVNSIIDEDTSDISKSLKSMGSQESLDAIDRLVENATRNKMIALQSK